MKVVVDSNRVIAALIKESTTREILLNKNFELIAPAYIKTEISKYSNEIISKVEITKSDFEELLSIIFDQIKIVPPLNYEKFIEVLDKTIVDEKDVPYLAVCLSEKALGIWTHDLHFKDQKIVEIFTNMDMLNLISDKE